MGYLTPQNQHDMHNLNEVNGRVSFASTQTAWHQLGQIVNEPMTCQQAIELGGLNYRVSKIPLYTPDNKKITSHMATRRDDTKDILGVVGHNYEVVQNSDAFGFFDTLLDQGSAKIETVGALGKGERIFVTAKLPHRICVGKEDLTEMYVLLTSSHDGSGAIVAGLTPIRVVCQNTLNMALSSKLKNRISVRHTANANNRVKQAGQIMRHALSYQTTLDEAYNFLFKTKVNDAAARDLIMNIMKIEDLDSTRIKNILEKIELCYNEGVGQESIVGTAWGVFNGITHYLSHEKNYKSQESKFQSLLLGGESEKIIKRSYDTLLEFAQNA